MTSKFLNMKIGEMFDMVLFITNEDEFKTKFPDQIIELKDILQDKRKNMNMKLAEDMKQKVIDRLLLPGIITKFIINFYIQAIRVFQFIDSSTILLEIVSEPIKEYLRSRKDTLRCIIKTIISGDESSELYQQLGNQYVQNNQMADGYMSSDEDEKAAEAWQPVTIQSDHTE